MATPTKTEPPEPEYLGDGVYATHDGYQIWLAVNHHTNQVVALEPQVFVRLVAYGQKMKAAGWPID